MFGFRDLKKDFYHIKKVKEKIKPANFCTMFFLHAKTNTKFYHNNRQISFTFKRIALFQSQKIKKRTRSSR